MSARPHQITLKSVFYILAGVIVSTISQAFFLVPNKIVPSGLVGLGTVLYHQFSIPIGVFTIAGNVFLIAAQIRYIGLGSSGKTIGAIIVQGFFLDFLTSVLQVKPWASDPMLASIYGGLLTGLGISLIFKGGGTLGGTDILAQLLQKFHHVPAGTTFLWSDIAVLGVAAMAYGPNLALYALIKSYIVSNTVDRFMEGSGENRQILIMSRQAEAISWGVMEELHRGVTIPPGRGGYTGRPVEVVLAAVRRSQLPQLEEIVYQLDPQAFIIVTDARRIVGKGFDNLEKLMQLKHQFDGTPDQEPTPEEAPPTATS
jgi:uncharacterized membrane-anchored protein YitT (DUF2179 family)